MQLVYSNQVFRNATKQKKQAQAMWKGDALLLRVSEILCHWAALVSVCRRLQKQKVQSSSSGHGFSKESALKSLLGQFNIN